MKIKIKQVKTQIIIIINKIKNKNKIEKKKKINKMKRKLKNKPSWTKTTIVVVNTMKQSAARAAHFNIVLLTKVSVQMYTDV